MTSRPISVVVPSRDRPELLNECLASIRSALRHGDELIVVDSASSTPAVREVAAAHGARFTRCDLPGASRARNKGWRSAYREIVAFIDDDVCVESQWAQAMAEAFGDPSNAFVTGRLTPTKIPGASPVVRKLDTAPSRIDPESRGIIGHSANVAVRKRALEFIGGFDERLGAGATFRAAEDLDLFDRLLAAGYTGRYEPSASAVHRQWRGRAAYVRLQGSYGVGSGARLSKLVKSDRPKALRTAGAELFDYGLRPLVRALGRRSWPRALARALRLAGLALGFVAGLVHPLRDGHLGGRRPPA